MKRTSIKEKRHLTTKMLANYSTQCYDKKDSITLTKPVEQKEIQFYTDEKGNEPFLEWLEKLRDRTGRKRILARLKRLQQGNYGDCEPVGEGVSELRMFFGPGYRAYFGEQDNNLIIMLYGGDKDSQTRDIETAKIYWKEYLNHEKDENT